MSIAAVILYAILAKVTLADRNIISREKERYSRCNDYRIVPCCRRTTQFLIIRNFRSHEIFRMRRWLIVECHGRYSFYTCARGAAQGRAPRDCLRFCMTVFRRHRCMYNGGRTISSHLVVTRRTSNCYI